MLIVFQRTGGGTVQSDLIEMDSSGQTTSNGQSQPWRANYRGDQDQPNRSLCTRDLICWSFQIARGMGYLASRKVSLRASHLLVEHPTYRNVGLNYPGVARRPGCTQHLVG